jgi:hypothetical protein
MEELRRDDAAGMKEKCFIMKKIRLLAGRFCFEEGKWIFWAKGISGFG